MGIVTEILADKLWQGDIEKLQQQSWLERLGVHQIATIMDFKPPTPMSLEHIFLSASDDSILEPFMIHDFCNRILRKPTYLHCYSGFNRSTTISCCCYILHSRRIATSILNVLVKRNVELARAHDGSVTAMTWQMMNNVVRYIDYLRDKGFGLS